MDDEGDTSKGACPICGLRILPNEDVCPHCGNVFRKDQGEWEWKLIPRTQKNPREETNDDTK